MTVQLKCDLKRKKIVKENFTFSWKKIIEPIIFKKKKYTQC